MVDVAGGIYEVLGPLDNCSKSPVSNGKGRSSATFPKGYSTYAVPRGVNGTPPRTRTIAPAVPPRNRNVNSESDLPVGSLGSSPNDKGRSSFARTLSYSGITKSPSVGSISEELSLNTFISKYSKSLPHKVKVCKGFYGVSDQTAVTTGDILNLHFLKSTKVVQIETGPQEGATSYNVPLTSAIQFSPLYDPSDRIEEAKNGYFFSTVADMLAMKNLPKIVRATRSFQGGSSDNSVAENELLLVKQVKNKLTGKQLRVYSLTSNRKKSLNENCQGSFTTAPDKLRMHLYEITVNLSDALPCKALVTMFNSAHQDSVLEDLHRAVVTLRKVSTETSVIATSSCTDEGEMPEVAEMPVSLDIEVEAVPLDEHDIEHLRTDTSFMYENFDPFSVCLYMTKPSRRMYDIQCMLYTKLMHGNDFRGLEIVRPHSISTISNTPTKRQAPNIPLPVAPVQRSVSAQSTGSSTHSFNPPSATTTPTGLYPPQYQGTLSTCSSSSSGYQSLNTPPLKHNGSAADYYVVMASNSGKNTTGSRKVSASTQDDASDQSGDSVLSHRDQLKMIEGHNQHLEGTVARNSDEIRKLNKHVEHLNKRIENLLNHIRIMSSEEMGSLKIPSGRSPSSSPPANSPPASVENRPPAPLPTSFKRNGHLAPSGVHGNGFRDNGTYHLVGGSLESMSPSPSPPKNGHAHAMSVYSVAHDDEVSMSNTDYLATLNHQQILELLDCMGLKQYQDHFKSEHVSGEILAECDDEMLASDLRVTSKLHRKRLLKVINGRHSARCILNGEDPYLDRKPKAEIIERSSSK